MKNILLFWFFLLQTFLSLSQSVAINADGSQPDNSAMLDIKSTVKGVLVPRMSTVERTAIATPATGLLVFDNDALSFWFYNGANWIELGSGGAGGFFSANGTNIYNTNAGNVGIGTATPQQPLTVQTPAHNYGFSHTDGTISLSSFLGGGAGGAWLGTISNHPLHIFTNNGVPQVSFLQNFITEFKGSKPWVRFYDGSTQSGTLRSNGNNLELSAYKPGTLFGTPGNLILQATTITQFQNEYGGKVGIGIENPADKLTVDAGTEEWGITQTDGTVTVGTWVGNNGGYFGTKTAHPLRFFTGNAPTQMTILTNGNVGIGTINPTYKLSVNGNVRSKEVVVESGWADYVFDDRYELPSLIEVENFIKANKHLPGISSAKEISENGLAVGEMQTKMMEKIEELTLYMIEANKQLKDAQQEITSLKKELMQLKKNANQH